MRAPPARVNISMASWNITNERIAATTTSRRISSADVVGEIVRRLATYSRRGVNVGTRPRYAIPSHPSVLAGRGQPTKNKGRAATIAVVARMPEIGRAHVELQSPVHLVCRLL